MSLADIFQSKTNSDVEREIVLELLNSERNLDEKTELSKPLKWSCLRTISSFLKNLELNQSNTILEGFMVQAFKFLISKSRKGRQEYIEALKSINKIKEEQMENEKVV